MGRCSRLIVVAIAVVLASGSTATAATDDEPPQPALTPPMGWNSWNSFGKSIDENKLKLQVDALVRSGMAKAGYEYFVVDGGWRATTRDANGNMQADAAKFPSGIKALADYVHSKGLKFGLHQPVGMTDCGGQTPGTQSAPGGEQQDADLFASWGVDFLKFDLCRYQYPDGATFEHRKAITVAAYERMATALQSTGRRIVYSISEYGRYQPWEWAPRIADMWRTTPDIFNCFSCPPPQHRNVVQIVDANEPLAWAAGPSQGWNDPDMLMVGVKVRLSGQNPGEELEMTTDEARAHFSLWSIMAAPLMAGADLTTMSRTIREIYTNRSVIAVNQDQLGVQGERVRDDGLQEVWSKPLADGSRAVVLLNRGASATRISTTAAEVGAPDRPLYLARDLWRHDPRPTTGAISAHVPAHGAAMFRITPVGPS